MSDISSYEFFLARQTATRIVFLSLCARACFHILSTTFTELGAPPFSSPSVICMSFTSGDVDATAESTAPVTGGSCSRACGIGLRFWSQINRFPTHLKPKAHWASPSERPWDKKAPVEVTVTIECHEAHTSGLNHAKLLLEGWRNRRCRPHLAAASAHRCGSRSPCTSARSRSVSRGAYGSREQTQADGKPLVPLTALDIWLLWGSLSNVDALATVCLLQSNFRRAGAGYRGHGHSLQYRPVPVIWKIPFAQCRQNVRGALWPRGRLNGFQLLWGCSCAASRDQPGFAPRHTRATGCSHAQPKPKWYLAPVIGFSLGLRLIRWWTL